MRNFPTYLLDGVLVSRHNSMSGNISMEGCPELYPVLLVDKENVEVLKFRYGSN